MKNTIEKYGKIKLKNILMIVIFVLLIICIIINSKIERNIALQSKQIKQAQEISELENSNINLTYEKILRTGEEVEIIITITENQNGLEKVEFPNGDILYCKGKNKVGIDYKVLREQEYLFKITSKDGKEEDRIIKIEKPIIPDPVITFDQEPYIVDGIKWYPYGTNITITYSENMEEFTGYYNINNTTWNSNGKNKIYEKTLSETTTIRAKIVNETKEESDVLEEEINIMPISNNFMQSEYRKQVGNKYAVLVTGTKKGAITGTDIYNVDQTYISTAATHMGLIGDEETKILIIEIVERPENGYIGSTRNGITSHSGGSGNGFVFIGENGQKIKFPTIESLSQVPSEDEIIVSVETQAYYGANISNYYYSINGQEFVESISSTHIFAEVEINVDYTISVYVKDSNGITSIIQDIKCNTNINEVKKWIKQANLQDTYNYTTIDEVLADNTCIQRLMNSRDAVDYMIRCIAIVMPNIISNENAMTELSKNEYAVEKVLKNDVWLEELIKSEYMDKIDQNSIMPQTIEKGEPICNSYGIGNKDEELYGPQNAFDGSKETQWWTNQLNIAYIGYDFKEPINIYKITLKKSNAIKQNADYYVKDGHIQYSDDGINWTNVKDENFRTTEGDTISSFAVNIGAHRYWRITCESSRWKFWDQVAVGELEMYGRIF